VVIGVEADMEMPASKPCAKLPENEFDVTRCMTGLHPLKSQAAKL
jgi:hypothetical protein